MTPAHPAVVMRNITKRFGATLANDAICMEVAGQSIHGIVGENGAGKSTIMKILYGLYEPDEGLIEIHGQEVAIKNPHDAIAMGIGMVHQHFMLVDSLTVLENIILGDEPIQGLFAINTTLAAKKIQDILAQMGVTLPLEQKVKTLSIGEKQIVELVKVLYRHATILILDEPTAVLTPQETQNLFSILRNLRRDGKTIFIITHKLPEVMNITENITVFRGGKKIKDFKTVETNELELAACMIGRALENIYAKNSTVYDQKNLLQLESITYHDKTSNFPKLANVSLQIKSHEIVGIAGVSGNGQTELEQMVSGHIQPVSGQIKKNFKTYAHIPEDRQGSAIVMDWSAEENLILGYQRDKNFISGGFYNHEAIATTAKKLIEKYNVQPQNAQLSLKNFSGGNQQKLVMARELYREPEFLLVAQPTRGVDIGAIHFIHEMLLKLRADGAGILLISADLSELMNLADRILVICKGKIVGEVKPQETNEERLGLMMSGAAA